MYGAFSDDKLIAFHDRRSVVETYVTNVYRYNKVRLRIRKIRKRQKDDLLKNHDDLYLVVYGNTYIQVGYLTYLELAEPQICDDTQFAIDVLCRLLEIRKLPKRSEKIIKHSVEVLEDILYEDSSYTPSLEELQRMKNDYDPYIYNYRLQIE